MELRHLRYFVAVAEELHFARAAARLGIEQSPLSRQIKELEAELGVRLFERTTRSTRLTCAGEVFLNDARRVLAAIGAMRRSVEEVASGKRGRVRIGVTEDVSAGRFPQFLSACRERAPAMEFRVFDLPSPQQVKGLRDGALEVAFLLGDPNAADLSVAEVWREPLGVLMPADHPLAKGASIHLSDLAGERFVMGHPEFGPGCYQQSMSLLRSAGIEPVITDYAFRRATMASLVAAGYGVTLAPSSFSPSTTTAVVSRPIADPGAFMVVMAAHRADETAESVRSVVEIARTLSAAGGCATNGRPDQAP